jgi:hypothetical protein
MFGLVDRRASVHPAIQSDGADFPSKSPQSPYPPDELMRGAHFGSAPIVARRRSSPHQRLQYSNLDQPLPWKGGRPPQGWLRERPCLSWASLGANAYVEAETKWNREKAFSRRAKGGGKFSRPPSSMRPDLNDSNKTHAACPAIWLFALCSRGRCLELSLIDHFEGTPPGSAGEAVDV